MTIKNQDEINDLMKKIISEQVQHELIKKNFWVDRIQKDYKNWYSKLNMFEKFLHKIKLKKYKWLSYE